MPSLHADCSALPRPKYLGRWLHGACGKRSSKSDLEPVTLFIDNFLSYVGCHNGNGNMQKFCFDMIQIPHGLGVSFRPELHTALRAIIERLPVF